MNRWLRSPTLQYALASINLSGLSLAMGMLANRIIKADAFWLGLVAGVILALAIITVMI